MRRREFIKVIAGSGAAWPLAARAQQSSLPVIGFLGSTSYDEHAIRLSAFRQGLKEAGYVEGQNVAVEYRWAEDQNSRLPALGAELVHRRVAVIVATSTPAALAAKATTATIPIVFAVGVDPVEVGFAVSLSHPGGNMTGVTDFSVEIAPKRLELLHELVPTVTNIAVLLDPANPTLSDTFLHDLQAAVATFGLQLYVLHASTKDEIDTIFSTWDKRRAGALLIGPSSFFNSRSEELAALTLRHAVPAIYRQPFAAAGGLTSYGTDDAESFRLVGIYAGKILKGEKPADLPVQQSTKVELVLNLKTAKALGITVPQSLLNRADEVVE